jgi:hypothetical protein
MQHFRLTSNELVEADVVRACLDLLVVRGWLPLRLHAGTLKTLDGKRWIKLHDKGTPDYVVTHWHWPAFFLETKRPVGGVLSSEQQQRQKELWRGFHQETITCRDALALKDWLDGWEQQHGPLPVRTRPRF